MLLITILTIYVLDIYCSLENQNFVNTKDKQMTDNEFEATNNVIDNKCD